MHTIILCESDTTMALRKIYTLGEPVLRRPAKKVSQFTKALQELVDDMVETMHSADGVGLAAPQIGISQRIIVVQLPEEYEHPEAGKLFALVNPEIVARSEEEAVESEGCLSIPNIIGPVKRSLKVTVKARDVRGRLLRVEAEGFLARAFQHEIDHLDGILFIDRVESPELLRRVTPEGEVVPLQAPEELTA
ncbi:MAG: peptide deformylase [Anaerolineae bacterium]